MPIRKWIPQVETRRCQACGMCGSVCPHDCLDVIGGVGVLVRPDACSGEGACVDACPEGAIRMRRMPAGRATAASRRRIAITHAALRR